MKSSGWRDPEIAQVLVDLKSADPTGVTAGEAIRTLLGFGERLQSIRRRLLHELVLVPPAAAEARPGGEPVNSPPATAEIIARYFDRTMVFWNPNKHRAWVRLADVPGWEVRPGRGAPRTSADTITAGSAASGAAAGGAGHRGRFGDPGLDDPAWDHVLVWNRGQGSAPADLAEGIRPSQLLAYGYGELYSLRWKTDNPEERSAWTSQIALARSRHEGLLVNPHFQDHRILEREVPLPLWGSPGDPGVRALQ